MRTVIVVAAVAALLYPRPSPAQSPAPALRIVVLEGEGAVNIIQQKTAVRPLVEVRDRNNVPVAGATVTFTIAGGQPAAFAGGVQTLTVTTNAAGQAAAGGFNVLGSGAVQVHVQAAYQGQLATAAISQTNFATAAAASQAGVSTGGSTAASSGAAGGGGISGTTLAIVGAAVAGGAVAATQTGVLGGGDGTAYRGSFSGQIVVTQHSTGQQGGTVTCVSTRAVDGTLTITLKEGDAAGELATEGNVRETGVTASPQCSPLANQSVSLNHQCAVTGGPSSLSCTSETSFTGTSPTTVTATDRVAFSGSLSNGTITGTLTYTHSTRSSGNTATTVVGDGTVIFQMTLR
jgi:hypothetical protein